MKIYQIIESPVLGYNIKDSLDQVMYATNAWHTEQVINTPQAGNEYLFKITFPANFGVGSYSVLTALVDSATPLTANYKWLDLSLVFNVINFNKIDFEGCQWLEPTINIDECTQ